MGCEDYTNNNNKTRRRMNKKGTKKPHSVKNNNVRVVDWWQSNFPSNLCHYSITLFFIALCGIAQRLMELRLKRQCNKLCQQFSCAPDEYLTPYPYFFGIVVFVHSQQENIIFLQLFRKRIHKTRFSLCS